MSCFTTTTIEGDVSIVLEDFTKPIDIYHPIISNAIIQLHTLPLNEKDIQFSENPNEQFGILEITVSKTKLYKNPIYLELDVDTSGSMENDDDCFQTKMHFVKKTLENMFEFLSQQKDATIYVKVNCFDNTYVNIIPITKITMDNHMEMIHKINNIKCGGCTNIEKTFSQSGNSIRDYKEKNPTHKVVYILLTDGNPTVGNIDISYLKYIKPNANNKCIGYGKDHNSELLIECGDYYFINDFENTGKVYGEILHKLLYPALENIEIFMKNGMIYDTKTNSWESSINESEMYSQQTRTFHIKCNKLESMKTEANIFGTIAGRIDRDLEEGEIEEVGNMEELCTAVVLPDLLNNDDTICPVDLRKYMYRQKTQELLFESIEYSKLKYKPISYKEKLQEFFKNMRSYMRDNDLLEDSFMKLLCDDIYVSFKTFEMDNSEMYVVSRHIGQCNQTPCRANSQRLEDSDDHEYYSLKREKPTFCKYIENDIDISICPDKEHPDDLNYYKSEIQNDDLYVSEKMINTMRCVSGF